MSNTEETKNEMPTAEEEASVAPAAAADAVLDAPPPPPPTDEPPQPVIAVAPAKKRGKPGVNPNPLDAVTSAALSTALQQMSAAGYLGLATLLAGALQEPTAAVIPSKEQVQIAAKKSLQDQPVWVHWSKQDIAPQFKVDSTRLTATGALRGYRMARASHGCSTPGSYYFEVEKLPGPTATEILNSLPPNARLGPGLREQLQNAVEFEERQQQQQQQQQQSPAESTTAAAESKAEPDSKKRKLVSDGSNNATAAEAPPTVGGHVRVGWSMRTGDLQAPVGYDKWSYGIRDTGGSILHCSQRQDHWGGEGFGVGDVIGCAITFDEHDESQNHIRFFKNGNCMGQFIISKGKREGGEAFNNIEQGTYYPAVSCYMGGSVRANFGPHWICPPKRSRLPATLKHLQPISSEPPLNPEAAVSAAAPTVKLFRKAEHQNALREAIFAEAEIQCQAYAEFLKNHAAEILKARKERSLPIADLPEEEEEQAAEPMET